MSIRESLFVFTFLIPGLAWAGSECQSKDPQLAHCPQAVRNFYSALVAVHGWNGSCDSTFGTQDHSLAKILGPHKFYDWDCFGYDSKKVSVADNARLLRRQLALLKANGYQDVLLITHSTGGILTLQLLVDAFSNPAQIPEDLPKIKAVLAWATPINGLRALISGPGSLLTRLGFSPETLPDLKPDSIYLVKLKEKLKLYNQKYQAASALTKGKMEVKVYFYQGQGDDMVVLAINTKAAEREGWYWPDRERVIDTQEGHTHNVGDAGTKLVPRYPAELLDLRALISVPVMPRYTEIFPADISLVPQSLESRQTEVIDGLTYFAGENFTGAFTPSLEFLRRMYQGSFERSRKVDEKLVLNFLEVLKRKAASPDDDLIRFFDSFVKKVLVGYDPTSGQDIRKLGHRNSRIVEAILETAETIRRAVNDYLGNNPTRADLLASYSSLDAFNTDLLKLTAKFLDSAHGPVQYAALSALEVTLPRLSDQVLANSGVVRSVSRYYLAGAYRNLSLNGKSTVANIYLELAARSAPIQNQVLAALNTKVPYLNKSRPSWVALGDDTDVESILGTLEPQPAAENRQQMIFAASVAAHGGATGTGIQTALTAIDLGKKIVNATPDPKLRKEFEAKLSAAAAKSGYPAVQMSLSPP